MGGSESKSASSSTRDVRPSSAKSTSAVGGDMSCFGRSDLKKLEITLATLGLDNAGKTSTVLALSKEPTDDVVPTVGFDSKKISVRGHEITLFDLGGGPKIRGIWKNYLADVHGVVYIVDAADPERVEEAAKEFRAICENTFVHGKPTLILANKSDLPEALSEYELTEMMDLEEIVNVNRIPTKVQASTTKTKDHRTLKDGMKWLYMSILADWDNLSERVTQDKLDAKEKQKADRRERLERIRKEREAREAEEGGAPQEEDNTDVMDGQDPFKRLDDHLKTKEEEEKKKKKEKKTKTKKSPRTPRSADGAVSNTESASLGTVSALGLLDHSAEDRLRAGADGEAGAATHDTHMNAESFPGLGQLPTDNLMARKSADRAPSPRPAPLGEGLGGIPSRLPPLGGGLPPLSGSSPLKPIDGFAEETVTKKKKKKKRKARITPSMENLNGLMTVEEENITNNGNMNEANNNDDFVVS